MKDNFAVKKMERGDLDLVLDWAAEEGWNPGLNDAECFYEADPDGFLIGYRGSEPVASISAVKYSNDFGFLGFYIVKPKYRGRGWGWSLWQKGLAYLKGCNIGLDGVLAQQNNYKKSGFKLAYRNIRYSGFTDFVKDASGNIYNPDKVDFPVIEAYDRKLFPANRSGFLKKWIEQNNTSTKIFLKAGEIKGYGTIRKCRSGYKIGPLMAENFSIAEDLFISLCKFVTSDGEVFLDIPEVNTQAFDLVHKFKLQPVFETARMYTGSEPEIDLMKIFGITSFELG